MVRLGSSAVTMVGHCRFLLTEEKKAEMEEGGGTKESTKVMRKTIGANFQQYVEEREAWWCGDPREAASWWTPPHSWISYAWEIGASAPLVFWPLDPMYHTFLESL